MIGKIQIKNSDVAISRLGLGCARLFAGSEIRSSAQLLETALGAGIRHFDTAPSYGGGTSESVLGQVLGGHDDVTITSKVGIPRPPLSTPPLKARVYRRLIRPLLTYVPGAKRYLLKLAASRGNQSGQAETSTPRRILSRDEILRSLEESLTRLKRTKIDLYLIHEPDQFVLNDELFEVFEELKRDGVIGAFGLGYGRMVECSVWPGAVIQGELNSDLAECFNNHTMIFHGLIRKASSDTGKDQTEQSPGKKIREILRRYPECAVLFSASSGHQIKNITKAVSDDDKEAGMKVLA